MTIPTQFSWKKIEQPGFTRLNLFSDSKSIDAEHQQAAIARGYEEGYAKGQAAGEEAAQAQLRAVIAQCEALMEETTQLRGELTHRVFSDAKTVYAELFRTLFDYELSVSAELVSHLVARAEEYLAGDCTRVHIHSTSEPALRDALQASHLCELLVVDDTIAPGAIGVSDDKNLVAFDPVAGFQAILQSMAEPELLAVADTSESPGVTDQPLSDHVDDEQA